MVARALQGVASACLGVCGMSLVAHLYPEEEKRSKIMGIILGSIALGVLLGYPFGGILYDFVGKSAPFYILSILILADLGNFKMKTNYNIFFNVCYLLVSFATICNGHK